MLLHLALLATSLGAPVPYPSLATDAGYALDGGLTGQVIDETSADAGSGQLSLSPRLTLRITGAKVLPPEVYLDLIRLPDDARATEATAQQVQRQVLDYLVRTGFELATVAVTATGQGLDVEVNEGQIERVLYLGQLSFQQVRFKLALSLPNDVFNRPMLDRQVRELSEAMNLPGVRWELVRNSFVEHVGPQVSQLPAQMDLAVQGAQLVHERRPYEVHLIFPETTGAGLGIDLRSGYLNGLEAGANYLLPGVIFDGDRAWAATSGGLSLRSRIDTQRLYAQFSRAAQQLRYDLFSLFGHLRPNVWAQGELLSRQRPDLWLENYWAFSVTGAVQLELEVRKGFHFQVGAGFEWRRLFGFELTAGAPRSPDVVLADRKRPYLRITHESVVDPTVLRWERRHTLESELRLYFPVADQPAFGVVDAHYQYVRSFGWHDFWVKSRGFVAWGDVTFHDELPVGEFMRGLFGDQFVPAAMNLQLEFRFSIIRDMLKLGFFDDLALFMVRPVRGQSTLLAQLADGFGPGVSFLANDMFQLDAYAAFGFRRKGQFGFAFSLNFQKAF